MAGEADQDGALLEFKIRSDGISVLAKAYDANGREITLPSRIVFSPQFFSVCEQVRLGTVETFGVKAGDKKSCFRAAIDISGRTGTVRMPRLEERAAVVPMFMNEPRVPPDPTVKAS